jgi:hypothetical protein
VSNCLIYVVQRWLKARGYVILRLSHWGWWPHFLWSKDLVTFEEFTPAKPHRRRLLPPVLFRGRVRTSRAHEQQEQ